MVDRTFLIVKKTLNAHNFRLRALYDFCGLFSRLNFSDPSIAETEHFVMVSFSLLLYCVFVESQI